MAMRPVALLAVALALLALSGCGGGGASAGSTSSRAAAGGEKSIEDFGSEARGAERAAPLAAFHGYLGALGAHDYPAACSHIAASVKQGLEGFVPPRFRRKGCAAILPKLLAASASRIARSEASGHVTKVRVGGNRGFVVFHAPGAKLYQLPMSRQAGAWKVALIAASTLVPTIGLAR